MAKRTKQTPPKPGRAKPTPMRTSTSTSPPEPDLRGAEALLLELLKVTGPSCREAEVARFVTAQLRRAGVAARAIWRIREELCSGQDVPPVWVASERRSPISQKTVTPEFLGCAGIPIFSTLWRSLDYGTTVTAPN